MRLSSRRERVRDVTAVTRRILDPTLVNLQGKTALRSSVGEKHAAARPAVDALESIGNLCSQECPMRAEDE